MFWDGRHLCDPNQPLLSKSSYVIDQENIVFQFLFQRYFEGKYMLSNLLKVNDLTDFININH
jgi:hypothetical protein